MSKLTLISENEFKEYNRLLEIKNGAIKVDKITIPSNGDWIKLFLYSSRVVGPIYLRLSDKDAFLNYIFIKIDPDSLTPKSYVYYINYYDKELIINYLNKNIEDYFYNSFDFGFHISYKLTSPDYNNIHVISDDTRFITIDNSVCYYKGVKFVTKYKKLRPSGLIIENDNNGLLCGILRHMKDFPNLNIILENFIYKYEKSLRYMHRREL